MSDASDGIPAAPESHADKLGFPRMEYLRRKLTQDAERPKAKITLEDLREFTNTFGDLADSEVMRQAWT
ncbi:MAG TPA: antitoxin [Jatrophihabitans sp.]|nr:antitoxin [Jatrophihabitans sp.]